MVTIKDCTNHFISLRFTSLHFISVSSKSLNACSNVWNTLDAMKIWSELMVLCLSG